MNIENPGRNKLGKHIGIIAVSAEGAALCYETICKEGASRMGRHMHPEITMHTIPLARHMEYIEASDWDGLGRLMASSAKRLVDFGAEILICPDNTDHLGFEEAVRHVEKPWLHIANEVLKLIIKADYKCVGLLGTKFLMESDVYKKRLNASDIECIIPEQEIRIEINRIIFDELVYGEFRAESRAFLYRTIEQLSNLGCQAVILGCTELPLIVSDPKSCLPLIDSTRTLARAALRESLNA
jgi:aspartate racemase